MRAAVFLTAAFGLAGSAAHAMPLLPAALQSPGEQATYAQRALWVACVHGLSGSQARKL